MSVPRYLRNAADVDAAIKIDETTEGLRLEFKSEINGMNLKGGEDEKKKKKESRRELCRDVSQFANTCGGCLIVGVLERHNPEGIKVATGYKNVEEPDKVREWVESAIASYCVPNTFSREIVIILHPSAALLAINVQPSRVPVVIWDRESHTMQAVTRSSHGKVYLNPDELERLRMNGSRAAKIAFDEARQEAERRRGFVAVDLVGGIVKDRPEGLRLPLLRSITISNVDDDTFGLCIPIHGKDSLIRIPYGLLRECWVDVENRLAMILDLPIVFCDGRLAFDVARG